MGSRLELMDLALHLSDALDIEVQRIRLGELLARVVLLAPLAILEAQDACLPTPRVVSVGLSRWLACWLF